MCLDDNNDLIVQLFFDQFCPSLYMYYRPFQSLCSGSYLTYKLAENVQTLMFKLKNGPLIYFSLNLAKNPFTKKKIDNMKKQRNNYLPQILQTEQK